MHNTLHTVTEPDSSLVTSAEASVLLGKSVSTISRLVKRGTIQPTAKLPGLRGAFLFNRADVEALAKEKAA